MGLFQRLNEERGITVVLITHEHDIAEYGTCIVSFLDGHIVNDRNVIKRRTAAEELAPSFGVSTDQVRAALDQAVDAGQIGVSVSYGIYLAVAGGVVVIVGGILGLRGAVAEPAAPEPDPSDEAPPWVPSPSEPSVPSPSEATEPSETVVAPPPPPGPDDD